MVTIPFSRDSLNLVNSRLCFTIFFNWMDENTAFPEKLNIINIVQSNPQLNNYHHIYPHSIYAQNVGICSVVRRVDVAGQEGIIDGYKILLFKIQKAQMKKASFECLRSINNQLHNKLSQENEYESYLKRIDQIVDRKPFRDSSPEFYMNFLHKCKTAARQHKQSEEVIKVVNQNKQLLTKIMDVRDKKMQSNSKSYHLNMHEKRNRQIEKINDQNMQIAKRITEQYSNLRRSLYPKELGKTLKNKSLEKKTSYANWNYSPLKERKLPRLVNSPRPQDMQASTVSSLHQ